LSNVAIALTDGKIIPIIKGSIEQAVAGVSPNFPAKGKPPARTPQINFSQGGSMAVEKNRPLSPSVEDYLEAIYMLDADQKGARSIDVAAQLAVSKPSVNKALHNMINAGLVKQEKYSLIYLTKTGREKAREVMTRHKTIKEFLVNILKVADDTAENEACMIEHAMSNETVSKMRIFLESKP
jgi:DtxR family Mn-dependent transcriptional regulator